MKKELTFTPRRIANTFKKHFKNVASDVVKNLPDPTGKFRIPLVRQITREFPWKNTWISKSYFSVNFENIKGI